MSEVVISGYYGFANAGDEAMLAAMIESLTDLEPDIKITVISGNPEETRDKHGVAAVYRLNYPAILRVLSHSDLLISGGGSLLQDVTSDRSLYYYLSIMLMAQKLGTKVMLYGQGIGPVHGSLAQAAMKYIGNLADLITVRDEGSYRELKQLGIHKPPIYVTADPVLAMHQVDRQIGRALLRRAGQEGASPLVGISAREWRDWPYYKQVLAEVSDVLIDELKARVVFIPMQYPDDLAVSKKIVKRMKHPAAILDAAYTTEEMLSLIGNLDMLISIRLHALIFAAVMHVPMLGVSYDPKIDRFLETLGERHVGTLKTVSKEALLKRVRQLWPELKRPNQEKKDRINSLRESAFRNAELALELIARG